ncbi:MAG: hypothetical protein ACFCU6_13955 [Balneolaceae bacterium]
MERQVLLVSILIITLLVNCGFKNNISIEKKYREAFNHIKNSDSSLSYFNENFDSNIECIKVSDQIVFMEIANFFDFFKQRLHHMSDIEVLDSLEAIDKNRYFESYTNRTLTMLSDCKEIKALLFFTKPFDDKLLAELFVVDKNQEVLKYDDLTLFNESLMYLFFFDDTESIKEVVTTNIIYN